MLKSIRWTLQLWHAAILFLAVASLAAVLYYSASKNTYTEIDNELAGAARVFASLGIPGAHLPAAPATPQLTMALRQADFTAAAASDSPAQPDVLATPLSPLAQLKQIPPDCLRRLGWDNSQQPYFVVWAPDGSVIRQSSGCPSTPAPLIANVSTIPSPAAPQFRQRDDLREIVLPGPAGSTILVGRSIEREQAALSELRWSLAGAGGLVMAIGLLGGFALSQRVLRPIHHISQTAQAISASDLSLRIDGSDVKSELGSLARTLNETFDRLESAFHRQTQFTADASHELRTPLAIIHSGSELALARHRSPQEYRQTLESNLRASKRMNALVDSLLLLARADADALALEYARFDLLQAAEDCVALLAPIAKERKITLRTEGAPLEIEADRNRILRLMTNLIGNAIQYNRDGGSVKVAVVREGDCAAVRVSDTGAGIALADQPRIFERFYRADRSRSTRTGGCGLGLAICKSIASAHGGDISFTSAVDVGTTFIVRLPISRFEADLPGADRWTAAKE
jgi:two-component system OmpR family sensor kinase